VVHLGWLFQPSHDPLTTWRVNAVGSGRLFDAVAEAGVGTLVYASSVGAYSPGPENGRGRRPVDESWPTDSLPTAAYGREKAYVERLLDRFEAGNPHIRVVRFRPGFIFQTAAATEQRRLFAGPFVPASLIRPSLLPVVPLPEGLRFQALHAEDAASAYAAALTRDRARGAYNLAAEPVVDAAVIGELLSARTIELPRKLFRWGIALGWKAHLVPADPALVDLFLSLPLMDTRRAQEELDWHPRHSSTDALRELLEGFRKGAGGATAPLRADSPAGRIEEISRGVGEL
jgi:UDP-glucose 4-epimerase